VTSLKDRQRAAARQRLEREMAERVEHARARRKRLLQALGAAAGVLVVVGAIVLIVNAVGGDKKTPVAAAPSSVAPVTCSWAPNPNPSASPAPPKNPDLKNTGTPPTTVNPATGTRDMVMDTSQGKITIALDVTHAPCASQSFAYLAGKKYFDNTTCHRLTTNGIYVLQCGDPTGSGRGGPSYTFGHENLPTDQRPTYSEGVVAMANPGDKDANGSQFFIVYKDVAMTTDPNTGQPASVLPADYTVIGTVSSGMDVVNKIAAAGVDAKNKKSSSATDGVPKLPVDIKTVTVGATTQ
jgi:peptidyl-prolyl cis-trans isomerase B (cyclophilin B)